MHGLTSLTRDLAEDQRTIGLHKQQIKKPAPRDCSGGPMAENLPCNAGDMGSIPD